MYTPTKEELEELWFRKRIYDLESHSVLLEEQYEKYFLNMKIDYIINKWFCVWYDDFLIQCYPRSFKHLKQIILAFNPITK